MRVIQSVARKCRAVKSTRSFSRQIAKGVRENSVESEPSRESRSVAAKQPEKSSIPVPDECEINCGEKRLQSPRTG